MRIWYTVYKKTLPVNWKYLIHLIVVNSLWIDKISESSYQFSIYGKGTGIAPVTILTPHHHPATHHLTTCARALIYHPAYSYLLPIYKLTLQSGHLGSFVSTVCKHMYNKNRIICINSKNSATLTQSNQSHREKNCDLIAFLCPSISGLEYNWLRSRTY